jgi:hypothetical protein
LLQPSTNLPNPPNLLNQINRLHVTLKESLLAARNPDGGWPYYSGKTSRLEPTAWALLALRTTGERVALDPLLAWPRRDGWFLDRSSDVVNVGFNGLLAVVLSALAAPRDLLTALATALVATKGQKLPNSPANRQDNSLQGWAWTEGTFSWVEPTAWCLIALKRLGRRAEATAAARIDEGERLLLDRVCAAGGWNFGNSDILGTKLEPYVSSTALGLLALADRSSTEAVRMSLQYLIANRATERSAMALGLTRIALGRYGSAADDVAVALHDEWHRSVYLGNLQVTALALYAEAAAASGYEAFRV